MELDRLQDIDHRRHQPLGEREGGVVLGVAADLQHPFAELGEGRGQVRRRGALADAALAVDREDLGRADIDALVLLELNAALAVRRACGRSRPECSE